jgi:hypothetical protein
MHIYTSPLTREKGQAIRVAHNSNLLLLMHVSHSNPKKK